MPGQVSPLPLPPQSDVEVSVKIHTPPNITSHVARQKVNRQIILPCGQSFSIEEPELYVGENVHWRAPIRVTHATQGRVARIGELRVDAQTGEVLATRELAGANRGA
jgi:heme oxygenase